MTEIHKEEGSNGDLLQVLYINSPKLMTGHLNQAKGLVIGCQKVVNQGAVSKKTVLCAERFANVFCKELLLRIVIADSTPSAIKVENPASSFLIKDYEKS